MRKYVHSEDVLDVYGQMFLCFIVVLIVLSLAHLVNADSYIPTMVFNGTENNYIEYCKVGDYCPYTDYYIRMKETLNIKNSILILSGLCIATVLTYYGITFSLKKLGVLNEN